MSKTMKIILSVVGLFVALIAVSIGYLYFQFSPLMGNAPPDYVVKNYIEEKYGFEIDIIETRTYGMGASPEFIVSPEKDEDIRFNVIVDSSDHSVIEDDYSYALEADKEFQKLKTVIPVIEEMGFTGEENPDIRLNYNYESISLILMDHEGINFKMFAADGLDRYYALYQLIAESQADLDNIVIADESSSYSLDLFMEPLAAAKNKEEFLTILKTYHPLIVSHELVRQLQGEAAAIENERFYFGNQFAKEHGDDEDPWLHCIEVSETAECTSAHITITYQEDGFTSDNPYFPGDLETIFGFIATHLEPEIRVETISLEADDLSGDSLEIGYEERMKYGDVDELIAFLLNE